jgi:hypothetical protein
LKQMSTGVAIGIPATTATNGNFLVAASGGTQILDSGKNINSYLPISGGVLTGNLDLGGFTLSNGQIAAACPTGPIDHLLSASVGGGNVVRIQNTNISGYSAIRLQDYLGGDHGALGYGNPDGVPANTLFLEISNILPDEVTTGIVSPFLIMQTGTYAGSAIASGQHGRVLFDSDGSIYVAPIGIGDYSVAATSIFTINPLGTVVSVLNQFTAGSIQTPYELINYGGSQFGGYAYAATGASLDVRALAGTSSFTISDIAAFSLRCSVTLLAGGGIGIPFYLQNYDINGTALAGRLGCRMTYNVENLTAPEMFLQTGNAGTVSDGLVVGVGYVTTPGSFNAGYFGNTNGYVFADGSAATKVRYAVAGYLGTTVDTFSLAIRSQYGDTTGGLGIGLPFYIQDYTDNSTQLAGRIGFRNTYTQVNNTAPQFFIQSGNAGTVADAFIVDYLHNVHIPLGGLKVGTYTQINDWSVSAGFAFFGNQALDQTNAANYCLLQKSTGETYLNAAAGKPLQFGIGNTNSTTLNSNGSWTFYSGATFNGLIFPEQASSAPSYVKGAVYFNTTLNKLQVGGATAWETVTSV